MLERADEGEAQAPCIIAIHMRSYLIPATSYIDIAIAPNKKVEDNIITLL